MSGAKEITILGQRFSFGGADLVALGMGHGVCYN